MAAYTTIDNPELYFQVKLYTGTGSSQAVTLDGDENMQPDMIWFKNRTSAQSHCLVDAVRGRKGMLPDDDAEEMTFDATKDFTSFDSDGFTVGIPHQVNSLNYNTGSIVAWCWKESATAGFDIVTFTGNGSNRTISHSLSSAAEFLIVKRRDDDNDWRVGSSALTNWVKHININTTAAESDLAVAFNSTAPTSSVFSVGTSVSVNADSGTYVAYLFRSIQGFSKIGKFTGNADADGPFVPTGFKPAWVIIKNIDSTQNWLVFDSKRPGYNVINDYMHPNTNDAETDEANCIDFLSNGFKIRSTGNDRNGSGNTLVYMCFAEAPFVNSNGVPCNAR